MQDRFEKIIEVVHDHLEKPSTSWSIGSFGAIAEFHMNPDESVNRALTEKGGTVLSQRGAIRIDLPENVDPAPYETFRRGNHRWLHGVNFCVPEGAGLMTGGGTLTEVGEDTEALRNEDKGNTLFDMGLGIVNVDACIRTGDAGLIAVLRRNLGRSILEPGNPAMVAFKEHSPHRVFKSCLGRVEVFQRIGSTAKGIPTPNGPHTHVLPRLLEHGRTHAANIAVPRGTYPALAMFPANPISNDHGEFRPFDSSDHQAFQKLVDQFGDAKIVRVKRATEDAVRQGVAPGKKSLLDRHHRTAVRVALRQLYWTDGETDALAAWWDAFEPRAGEEDDFADEGN